MENQDKSQDKRLQELMSMLQWSNRPNEHAKFKIRGEEAKYAQELLLHTYASKVKNRIGSVDVEIEKAYLDSCVRWMTDDTYKPSLMLYGTPGTGKTTFMSSMYDIYNQMYSNNIRYHFRYEKASELGIIAKNDPDRYKELKNATILFIDDLGFNGESEMVNDYGVKRRPIEEIIEYRYDKMRATCCTSNLTQQEIRAKYGERIYSRMCEQFAFVAITGVDHRMTK